MRRETRSKFNYSTLESRLLLAGDVGGGIANDGLVTPADTIHPNIHQNNNAGNNANPNGVNDGGGNMHGIGNNPGQSDADPADGEPGFADQLETVHGGIGAYNPNASSDAVATDAAFAEFAVANIDAAFAEVDTSVTAVDTAGANNDNLNTPADTIHPNIHQNNNAGNNANPNGNNNPNGSGANMHGIGNNPGQSDADPADGEPGFADQLETVHGGIGAYNPNA